MGNMIVFESKANSGKKQVFSEKEVESFARLDSSSGHSVTENWKKLVDVWKTKKEEQKEEYMNDLVSKFLNRRSGSRSTALHYAVRHSKHGTIRWLLSRGAKPSLSKMNKDYLTPLTLAARNGDVQTLKLLIQIAENQLVWHFGSVSQTRTKLEYIDSFRISSPLKWEEIGKQKPNSRKEFEGGREKFDHLTRDCKEYYIKEGDNYLKPKHTHLHSNKEFKSALEIVVFHEVGSFHVVPGPDSEKNKEHGCTLFQELIREKWEKFACSYHLKRVLVPQCLFTIMYVILALARFTLIYERRFGVTFESMYICIVCASECVA